MKGSDDVASTKDPQSFRGSKIFCGSRSDTAHIRRLRDMNRLYDKYEKQFLKGLFVIVKISRKMSIQGHVFCGQWKGDKELNNTT